MVRAPGLGPGGRAFESPCPDANLMAPSGRMSHVPLVGKPNKLLKRDRIQISMHRHLRLRAEEVAGRRGLSFSEHLEELVKQDLAHPTPSPYDPPKASGRG